MVGTSLYTSLTVMRLRSSYEQRWKSGVSLVSLATHAVNSWIIPNLVGNICRSDTGHLLFNTIDALPRNDPTNPRAACLNAQVVFGNTCLSDDPESGPGSSASSESSSHGTGDSVREEDEQLNEDEINTKAKHTALMDRGDTSAHASSRQRKTC